MSEPITHCAVCGTHWSNVELLADGVCATCLQAEIKRLREELANRTQAARWLYQWVENNEWTHFDADDVVVVSHWPWLKEVTDE